MSGTQLPPSHPSAVMQNAGTGWQGPSRVWGVLMLILVGVGVSAIAYGLAWWIFLRDRGNAPPTTRQPPATVSQFQERPQGVREVAPGGVQQVVSAVTGRPAGSRIVLPEPARGAVLTTRAPAQQGRQRVQGSGERQQRAPEPMKLAGMTILEPDVFAGDGRFLVAPGMKIACTTVEPIRGVEGHQFTAEIAEDVRGVQGTFPPAIPRGATALFEIVGGPTVEGSNMRIRAVAKHIRWPTPPGKPVIMMPLNSSIAEPQGDMDARGNTRTFFLEKLAAVSAYAVVDMAVGAGSALLQDSIAGERDGGTNILIGPQIRRGGQSLAQSEWGRQAQRKPEFERPAGQPCQIFVQHPLYTKRANDAWQGMR